MHATDWSDETRALDPDTGVSYAPGTVIPAVVIEALRDPERPRATGQDHASALASGVTDHAWRTVERDGVGMDARRFTLRGTADPSYAAWRAEYAAWARRYPPTRFGSDVSKNDYGFVTHDLSRPLKDDPYAVAYRRALADPEYIAATAAYDLARTVFMSDYDTHGLWRRSDYAHLVARITGLSLIPAVRMAKGAKPTTESYAVVPDGMRVTYADLIAMTGRSRRTVQGDMKRLVQDGTWATEEVVTSTGGKPTRVFWRVADE